MTSALYNIRLFVGHEPISRNSPADTQFVLLGHRVESPYLRSDRCSLRSDRHGRQNAMRKNERLHGWLLNELGGFVEPTELGDLATWFNENAEAVDRLRDTVEDANVANSVDLF